MYLNVCVRFHWTRTTTISPRYAAALALGKRTRVSVASAGGALHDLLIAARLERAPLRPGRSVEGFILQSLRQPGNTSGHGWSLVPDVRVSQPSYPAGPSFEREGDLLVIRVKGEYTLDVATQVHEQNTVSLDAYGYQLNLMDFTHFTSVTPEARRYVFRKPERSSFLSATAIVGANFPMRALVQMLLRALRAISNRNIAIEFFANEQGARDWIDDCRRRFHDELKRPSP